jgi:uncharacterized protein YecT (DUF1311 family)
MITPEEISCLSDALRRAQSELSAKYAAVQDLKKITSLEAQLDRSQRTWNLYVRQTCDDLLLRFWQGGTIQRPASLRCTIELTRERTQALDTMFNVPLNH